jgi:predicted AAA+ superfamily ATPase
MQDLLSRLIDEFHERQLPDLLPRDQNVPDVPGKANAIVGMRRVGKTWFCYQRMQTLLSQGIAKERLLYLNFEDERLLPFTTRDFQTILDTYYRKFPDFKQHQCYLFLDEVQQIDGWDKFVRRVLDTEPLSVWVTGSSSKLLSSEIATSLRGRSLTTEVFPFSFKEFLRLHDVKMTSTTRFGSQTRAMLQHMAERYLTLGGFPEVQRLEADTRHQVLRNYLDAVILRDIIERFAVRNTTALRSLIRHIMAAPATRFSVNKFYHTLRSQGIRCTKNNLYDYLVHLSDAFLVYQVPLHTRSAKARQVNPKKIYAIDTGLLSALSFQMTGDRGARLENLVFMHLRAQGLTPEYYITPAGAEIDFVLPAQHDRQRQLIQVCWSLDDPTTRKREIEALRTAMQALHVQQGTVVTWLHEASSDRQIAIVPVWKWLLTEAS